jgi:tRNA(Arg) A34 adenosine deaminase TadA
MERPKYVKRYIDLAIKVASTGQHQRHFHGAVLVKGSQVVSLGSNNFKSHPLMSYKTLHSEISCLLGVRWKDLSDSTMFVARISKNGKVGMSKPCPICYSVLLKYGIRRVYYTTSSGATEVMDMK